MRFKRINRVVQFGYNIFMNRDMGCDFGAIFLKKIDAVPNLLITNTCLIATNVHIFLSQNKSSSFHYTLFCPKLKLKIYF